MQCTKVELLIVIIKFNNSFLVFTALGAGIFKYTLKSPGSVILSLNVAASLVSVNPVFIFKIKPFSFSPSLTMFNNEISPKPAS
jgi:hypothetical protein